MKRLIPFWLLGCVIWTAGCAAARPQPNLTPTAAAPQATVTVRQPIPPTQVIPPTPTTAPTNTPPPTSTITPSPTPTPTPTLPMPPGRLLFFWDPRPRISDYEPAPSLYVVSPDPETRQWDLQTILYYPVLMNNPIAIIPNMFISPDEEWLALGIRGNIEDNLTPRERPVDADKFLPTLYFLNLNDFSYHRLVEDYWAPWIVAWLDDQTVVYSTGVGVFSVDLAEKVPQPLGIFDTNDDMIDLRLSPDQRFWAVGLRYSPELKLIDWFTSQTSVVTEIPLYYQFIWSPSSEWLATSPHLSLISPHTLEVLTLTDGYRPVWSPDSQWLVFETATPEGINKNSENLYLWNANSGDRRLLLDRHVEILNPLWKPDSLDIVVGLRQEEVSSLSLISIPDGTMQLLHSVEEIVQMTPCAWSPDGEWLVFFMQNGQRTKSGIYVIHQSGQGLYPLLESAGPVSAPWACFWLSK